MPCPYANLLGTPGEGVHARRIAGYALNDILATILGAIITSYIYKVSFIKSFVAWFVLGEVLHIAFGTQTAFLTSIGLRVC
jgi:5-bromo-4-chloroindolyl phosphate hydrolysis protein